MLALWIIWAVLTVAVVLLAVARKVAARNEDDYVHLSDPGGKVATQQVAVAQRLDWFDHWGKTLTVIDVTFGAVLVLIMLFTAWRESMTMTP